MIMVDDDKVVAGGTLPEILSDAANVIRCIRKHISENYGEPMADRLLGKVFKLAEMSMDEINELKEDK